MARGAALLISNGVNPNIKVRGYTPLCEAIQRTDLNAVRLLFSKHNVGVKLPGASNEGGRDAEVSPLGRALRNLSRKASLQKLGLFWRARRFLN